MFLASAFAKEHQTGPGHPEQSARFDAALKGLPGPVDSARPRAATEDELALCHTREYIAIAKNDVASGLTDLSTGDTRISPGSLDAALHAAGTMLTAVDRVVAGEAKNAFCVVRPPGHHARPDQGMGFCLFNSVAIAARYAQRKYGVERVLIADWDVHHGNGTQDVFYSDKNVFFFSTHQDPWYPGTGAASETGEGAAAGTTMNCPLPAGSGREQIVGAFERLLIPEAEKFRPELILISAGFDSRAGDPLGNFLLTDKDFFDLTQLMMELADHYAGGRLVSILEGGYSLEGLTAGVSAHSHALEGKNLDRGLSA